MVGPLLLPPAKMELWNAVPENAQTLIEAGCLVCLTADTSSETKWLPRDIGVCIAHGLDEKEAFKGVTINPAKLLGIEDKARLPWKRAKTLTWPFLTAIPSAT